MEKPPCHLRSNRKNTINQSNQLIKVYQTKKNVNCNFKMVVYLAECRVCGKKYNGSYGTKFCDRVNNYKSTHRTFRKELKLSNQARKQKRFYKHYLQSDKNGICDWEMTITDHAEIQNELCWYRKLKTYVPFGLNERGLNESNKVVSS